MSLTVYAMEMDLEETSLMQGDEEGVSCLLCAWKRLCVSELEVEGMK